MHRLAALSTRKCTLETYRSIPPFYKIAEGPSLANHPKLQDGSEATMWVSQGWPHRRMSPKNRSEKCPCSSRGSNLGLMVTILSVIPFGDPGRCICMLTASAHLHATSPLTFRMFIIGCHACPHILSSGISEAPEIHWIHWSAHSWCM